MQIHSVDKTNNFLTLNLVAQLVDALHYKPEGHGFDSRWCHWPPGVDSASNRNVVPGIFPGG